MRESRGREKEDRQAPIYMEELTEAWVLNGGEAF